MKKLVVIALAAAVGLLAQGPGGRAGRMGFGGAGFKGPGGPQSTVAGAPYSGVEVTTRTQILTGGNTIQTQRQSSVYRDSQGRVRTETAMQRPGAPGTAAAVTAITIHDPVAGVMRHIDTQNKVVTERAVHAGARRGGAAPAQHAFAGRAAGARHGADPNVTTEELGQQSVGGVAATGQRITRTIPAGAMGNAQAIQSSREVWTSTELKVPVLIKISDPRFGTTVTQLNNITRAEPDAALFQAPAGYTVRQGPAGRPMGMGRGAHAPQQ